MVTTIETVGEVTTVKIDKFGRLLIPKRLRLALGLKPGCSVELALPKDGKGLVVQRKQELSPQLITTRFGLPAVNFGTDLVDRTDMVAAIKVGREERDAKVFANE